MGNSASEIQRARHAATDALALSNLSGRILVPVSVERHIVFAAEVDLPEGRTPKAIRVMQTGVDPRGFIREQRYAADASRLGAPVVSPFQPVPVQTDHGIAGIWDWHPFPAGAKSMGVWGAKTTEFEVACERAGLLDRGETYDAEMQFSISAMRKRIEEIDGHPLQGRDSVISLLEQRLAEVQEAVLDAVASQDTVFLHGDNHPLNSGGEPFLFGDLEYCGPGPKGAQAAMVKVGADLYEGWTPEHLRQYLAGMGPNAPTEAEIEPFARQVATVWVGWVLMYGEGPEQRAVLEGRIDWLDQPDAPGHARWQHVGNAALMDTSNLLLDPDMDDRADMTQGPEHTI